MKLFTKPKNNLKSLMINSFLTGCLLITGFVNIFFVEWWAFLINGFMIAWVGQTAIDIYKKLKEKEDK